MLKTIEIHGRGDSGSKEFTIKKAGDYNVEVTFRGAEAIALGIQETSGDKKDFKMLGDGSRYSSNWKTDTFFKPGTYVIIPYNMVATNYAFRIRVRRLPDKIVD